MFKKQLLLLFGLFVSSLLFAQSREKNDEAQAGKYTLKIISNQDNTYGYEIYEAGKLNVKQVGKPFFSIPIGFSKKENAMIIAKWNANELQQGKTKNIFNKKKERPLFMFFL